ncbi:LysM peptidoglycan-binding domain-containing protein [Pseudomonas resinovorans]|uniref:LysM peptidoglycan-binding domain-containing protein n=1 Tax=Metapseudomonas resinovorans TaxID=53412 RepID=A0ABT4YD13_METRE|nr:LysM domain-containing protein [Pseudomonas resinovorans]MDA8486792.1 LysM peptidoglycan-binding domain-containing protein [Pseudomonas resinovorans]
MALIEPHYPYHLVQQGETLGHIAERYGASVAQLRQLNPFIQCKEAQHEIPNVQPRTFFGLLYGSTRPGVRKL